MDLDIEKIDQLYKIFQNDLINNTIYIGSVPLVIKPQMSNYQELPELTRYNHNFVHCISRKSDLSGKRYFEPKRANRVHWIKPILENHTDIRIRHFKFKESNGRIRDYFWHEEKEFVVIIEMINAEYFLISTHCVDDHDKYSKRYHCYRRQGI
ncbi:MAG: hypothetical protein JW976_04175 [Syntrophaceae bacterium]|nr:hypothetical protein [Syntrophaceae bacterium]